MVNRILTRSLREEDLFVSEVMVDGSLYVTCYSGYFWNVLKQTKLWRLIRALDWCQVSFGEELWIAYILLAWVLLDVALVCSHAR